jgi:hypothetical protein
MVLQRLCRPQHLSVLLVFVVVSLLATSVSSLFLPNDSLVPVARFKFLVASSSEWTFKITDNQDNNSHFI